MNTRQRIGLLLLCLAGGLLLARAKGCDVVGPGKATAATYFFDDKQHAAPSPVLAALDKLNRAGILATQHEVNTTDPSGDVPEQYKVSLPAAQEAGLPALVVMAGDKVRKVVKDPRTAEQVMEAAQ